MIHTDSVHIYRESEAWEDFGTGRYTPGQENYASSRESVLPPGVSKEDRMGRAQSIWDIEVTLLRYQTIILRR